MSKPKKNIGKMKRYRRIFHTRDQLIRSVLSWAVGIAVVFAAGYAIAPAVLDFGTHTWYTVVRGRDLDTVQTESETAASATGSDASQSEPEATPEPTPQPTPEPAVDGGSWSFASLAGFSSEEKIAETARQYRENGIHYVVVPLKDSSGYLYYQSSLADSSRSVAATTIDAAAVAKALRAEGLEPVASVYAFQDPIAPYTNRDMGIHYQDTEYFWLDAAQDAGGKPWLDPWSDSAVSYIDGVLSEVKSMGYNTILLNGVQYPTYATDSCGYANNGTADSARLAQLISTWSENLTADGGMLWVQYSLSTVASTDRVTILGGVFGDLGVKNLMLSVSADTSEEDGDLLNAAISSARNAGAEYIAVKTGDSAVLQ